MNIKFSEYQNLDVWKESYKLTTMVYEMSKEFPNNEIYGLTQQIRRASISIISNIAEGCGRNHTKDKLQFFYIARGSLFEVESQYAVANKLGFLSDKQKQNLCNQSSKCKMILSGFIAYHKQKIN